MNPVVVSAPRLVAFLSDGNLQHSPLLIAATSERIAVSVSREKPQKNIDAETKALMAFVATWLKIKITDEVSVSVVQNNAIKLPTDAVSWCVAVVGALIYSLKGLWNPLQAQDIAYAYLKSRQPAAGGLVTAAVIGGFVWYREELSFLKNIWQLPIVLDKALQRFYMASGARPRSSQKSAAFEKETKLLAEALKSNDDKTIAHLLSKANHVVRYASTGKSQPAYSIPIILGSDGITLDQK